MVSPGIVMSIIPLGNNVRKVWNYNDNFFLQLTKLLFSEILGVKLEEQEIKKFSSKIQKNFEHKNKNLSIYRLWKIKRNYFKLLLELGKLIKKLDQEVFEYLIENGHIMKYLISIEKIILLIHNLKKSQKITKKIFNFINIVDIETNELHKEYNDLFIEIFLFVQELKDIDVLKLFQLKLNEYSKTPEYKSMVLKQREKLISLITISNNSLKHKEKIKLNKLKNTIEDVDIETFFFFNETVEEDIEEVVETDTTVIKNTNSLNNIDIMNKVETIVNNTLETKQKNSWSL